MLGFASMSHLVATPLSRPHACSALDSVKRSCFHHVSSGFQQVLHVGSVVASVGRDDTAWDGATLPWTAPPLVGRSDSLGMMMGVSADASEEITDGFKFSVKLIQKPEERISGEGEQSVRSFLDALGRAFEPPFRQSGETSAVIEETGPSPSFFGIKGGADPVQFALVSAGLIFVWWLGNYYVPDQVFKDTVFRNQPKDNAFSVDVAKGEASATTGADTAEQSNVSRASGFSEQPGKPSKKPRRKTKRS